MRVPGQRPSKEYAKFMQSRKRCVYSKPLVMNTCRADLIFCRKVRRVKLLQSDIGRFSMRGCEHDVRNRSARPTRWQNILTKWIESRRRLQRSGPSYDTPIIFGCRQRTCRREKVCTSGDSTNGAKWHQLIYSKEQV